MLSFRLALPEPRFDEVIAPDGVAWQRLVVPGVDNLDGPPGLPATPIWRTLIAVPRGAQCSDGGRVRQVAPAGSCAHRCRRRRDALPATTRGRGTR